MSNYHIKFVRKRFLSTMFKKVDAFELYGPVKYFYPDTTCGNGGTEETKIVITKLETFFDEDEAYNVMEKYKEYESNF